MISSFQLHTQQMQPFATQTVERHPQIEEL